MAKHPANRFTSAKDFALALSDAQSGVISEALRNKAEGLLEKNPWGMLPDQPAD